MPFPARLEGGRLLPFMKGGWWVEGGGVGEGLEGTERQGLGPEVLKDYSRLLTCCKKKERN